jgi:hypothetical protein
LSNTKAELTGATKTSKKNIALKTPDGENSGRFIFVKPRGKDFSAIAEVVRPQI